MTTIRYSEMLHNSAAKWGLDVVPGRPLITDGPTNPYQQKILPTKETLQFDTGSRHPTETRLFRFNGQWGYCLSLHVGNWSTSYGAFLKFCDPYPTREAAIHAAARDIIRRIKGKKGVGKLAAWAKSLLEPRQLSIF